VIPEPKQAAVAHALRETFGTETIDDISALTGGLSTALVCRIVVRGKPYVLRLMRHDVLGNPANQFTCLQIAAGAGIAPQVLYANRADWVLISDFVDARPYPDNIAQLVAATLRRLHTLRGFPRIASATNYFGTIDRFIGAFRATGLADSKSEEVFRGYAEVVRVYPWRDDELVACHNDLKPQNMLFDGARLWIVDWESAFLNDRYLDLVYPASFFVADDTEEIAYLTAYFGASPDEYQRARFFLMRQVLHAFAGALLGVLAARAGAASVTDALPTFREFHQQLINGSMDLATPQAQQVFSQVHLMEALREMRSQRFADSLHLLRRV
jgi:thiamine kinase-like enzyme